MARTVKVSLALEVAAFLRGADSATKSTKGIGEELADAARAGDATARAMDDVAEEMTDAARAAAGLDRQIDELNGSLRALVVQQALAGAAGGDFAKQIREQQAELRRATRNRKLIDPGDAARQGIELGMQIGVSTASGFFTSFRANITKAAFSPAGIAVGTAIAVPAAAILGATISGAVIGGAGVGGVIGGIAVASKDARVQSAAHDLAGTFRSTMETSAGAFVPATLRGIDIVRSSILDLEGDLEGIFDKSAEFVAPLTRGLAGWAKPIVAGFRDLVEAADPIIEVLEQDLPMVGDAIGDVLTDISGDADAGASALHGLLLGLADGIRFVGGFIGVMTDLYRVLVEVGLVATTVQDALTFDWMPLVGEKAAENRDRLQEMKDKLDQADESGKRLGADLPPGFELIKGAVAGATTSVADFAAKLDGIRESNLSLAEANLRLKEAAAGASDAVDGKRAVSDKEQASLIALARAGNRVTESMDAQGTSADVAAESYANNSKKLYDAARAAGKTDAEAKTLVATWLKVPKNVKTHVTATGVKQVKDDIAGIKGKTINIALRLTGATNAYAVAHALAKNQRWGGVYDRAQEGLLRESTVYTPRNPGRYMIAEPATGGELFAPKYGEIGRASCRERVSCCV